MQKKKLHSQAVTNVSSVHRAQRGTYNPFSPVSNFGSCSTGILNLFIYFNLNDQFLHISLHAYLKQRRNQKLRWGRQQQLVKPWGSHYGYHLYATSQENKLLLIYLQYLITPSQNWTCITLIQSVSRAKHTIRKPPLSLTQLPPRHWDTTEGFVFLVLYRSSRHQQQCSHSA